VTHTGRWLTIVIPTKGRHVELRRMFVGLAEQTRLPEELLIDSEGQRSASVTILN